MTLSRRSLVALALAGLLSAVPSAAQVPPHVPGSICFTPNFWCWANPPGEPGKPCKCGNVPGVYG